MALQAVDLGRSGGAGPVTRLKGTVVLDLASCGAAAVTLQSVLIPGVKPGDMVLLTPKAADLSVAVGLMPGYCLVAGTAKVPAVNPTAGALDPASQTFDYCIFRSGT